MKEIDKIKLLIPKLPSLDVKIGNKFLQERNFSELQLLVDSAIIKVKHNISSSSPKEEYKNIDLESLETLSMLISSYRDQLIEDISTSTEFEDDEITEDFTSELLEDLY